MASVHVLLCLYSIHKFAVYFYFPVPQSYTSKLLILQLVYISEIWWGGGGVLVVYQYSTRQQSYG